MLLISVLVLLISVRVFVMMYDEIGRVQQGTRVESSPPVVSAPISE